MLPLNADPASELRPGGIKRRARLWRSWTWPSLCMLLLAAPALACTLTTGPAPTATPTASPSPTITPTSTPTPQPTGQSTPTLAPAAEASPTLRVAATLTPTPQPSLTPTAAPPLVQAGLVNPSFECPYESVGAAEFKVPRGWIPWHFEWGPDFPPEFKPAEAALAPNRVRDGGCALQYFKSWGTYHAGVFQKVKVTPGVRLRFTAYGQAWSRDENVEGCAPGMSCSPADMGMRIGIDVLGGSDPLADSIEWSAQQSPIDAWMLFSVEAAAESDVITVFVWSSPNVPRINQDTYWDDANLELLP